MRRRMVMMAACLALVAGTALAQSMTALGTRPDCVTGEGQAMFTGYGYRHSVHIANRCDYAVECTVFTDVNPQVQSAHVAPGASVDVATYLSSPARTFVSHVDCPHEGHRAPSISDPSE